MTETLQAEVIFIQTGRPVQVLGQAIMKTDLHLAARLPMALITHNTSQQIVRLMPCGTYLQGLLAGTEFINLTTLGDW